MNVSRNSGRRVLITGAAGGIGSAAGAALAAEGAAVGLVDRDQDTVEAIAAQINAAGGKAVGAGCDVGDAASVSSAVRHIADSLGGIDGVVTCAGIAARGLVGETQLEDWDRVLRVNLTGTFLIVRETLPYLLASGGGAIVTIGSVASLVAANTDTASYDASKSGVLGLTRSIAAGYADKGIRANCVCPGVVETEMARASRKTSTSSLSMVDCTPLGRGADPSEIASVIAFLLSDESSFMTGSAVTADGGLTSR